MSTCREIVLQGHRDDQVRHHRYLSRWLLLLRVLAALLLRAGIVINTFGCATTEIIVVVGMDGATLEVLVN